MEAVQALETVVVDPTTRQNPKFYRMSLLERQLWLWEKGLMPRSSPLMCFNEASRSANKLIEQLIGTTMVPLAFVPRILLNGKVRTFLMATEEYSVVAALQKAVKLTSLGRNLYPIEKSQGKPDRRSKRTFRRGVYTSVSSRSHMYGQVTFKFRSREDAYRMQAEINGRLVEKLAAYHFPLTIKYGGDGVKLARIYMIEGRRRTSLNLLLDIDPRNAMGANLVTKVAEGVAHDLHQFYKLPRATQAICTNYRSGYAVSAEAAVLVPDAEQRERIIDLFDSAHEDIVRRPTHAKGILNGTIALALATGQDTRAIQEAMDVDLLLDPTQSTRVEEDGETLTFHLKTHIPCGVKGGATGFEPFRLACEAMRIESGSDLAQMMAAAGLLQNIGAIMALSSKEGLHPEVW